MKMKLLLFPLCMFGCTITLGQRNGRQRIGEECCATLAQCKKPGVACPMMCHVGIINADRECIAMSDMSKQERKKLLKRGEIVDIST